MSDYLKGSETFAISLLWVMILRKWDAPPYLKVYINKSELVLPDGTVECFLEGGMNQATKTRYRKLAEELSNDYLERQILSCQDSSSNLDFSKLTKIQFNNSTIVC
jgi:hypothetical protein